MTLVSIDSKHVELKVNETGQPLEIENVPKHTKEDVQTALKKIVGPKTVDLSRFTADERDAILEEQVGNGMTRKAVLSAIGYPPQIATPSLNADEWIYCASRFDRFIVRFKDDKVAEIRN